MKPANLCNQHREGREMRTSKNTVRESSNIIHSEETKRRTVKDPDRHFTRKRKLTYVMLVSLIMSHFQTTIQSALNHFRPLMEAGITIYQSAFSQARARINDTVFRELFEMTARTGYESRSAFKKAGGQLYEGRLVCAIDGSVHTPNCRIQQNSRNTSG